MTPGSTGVLRPRAGGIALVNSNLEINNSYVGVNNSQFNTATGNGGGIHALNSTLDFITLAYVQRNVSGNHGGGIYAEDSIINMNFGRIDDNQAEFSGGGFFLHDTNLISLNTRFEANVNNNQQPNSGGGGLYAETNSLVTIRDTDFNLNVGHLGGGIHVRSGSTLDIDNNSTLTGNFATNGGAIHAETAITLDDTTISNNLAADNGGGIHCFSCDDLDISLSQITNNTADSGGGLYVTDSDTVVDIISTSFDLNNATSTLEDQGEGGGVYMAGGLLTVTNSVIDQNSSSLFGGGLYLEGTPTNSLMANIVNTAITSNTTTVNGAGNGGAGLYARTTDIMFTDALFQLNQTPGVGGGARFELASIIDISGTVFDQNIAEGFGGGGIYVNNSTLNVHSQSQFTNNDGDAFGGGIRLLSGSAVIRDAVIANNYARFGGGIQSQSTTLEVVNSRIVNNSGIFGGGLYANRGNIEFRAETGSSPSACDPAQLASNEYCMEISGNSVTDTGGGVHLIALTSGNFTGTFDQVAFQNNQAEIRGSALVFDSDNASPG